MANQSARTIWIIFSFYLFDKAFQEASLNGGLYWCNWCSHHILTLFAIYYWTVARGIYLFYIISKNQSKGAYPSASSTGLCISLFLLFEFLLFQNQKARCSENEVVYDLLATVGHVQDFKSGGNLVAHIHVGNTYHSRKEVRASLK